MAFPLGNDTVVYLWIRTRGKANTADVGVYYLLPRQDNDTDKLFYKELKDISRPSFVVLVCDFNFPAVSWECHTGDTNRSWKFLTHIAGTKGAK